MSGTSISRHTTDSPTRKVAGISASSAVGGRRRRGRGERGKGKGKRRLDMMRKRKRGEKGEIEG